MDVRLSPLISWLTHDALHKTMAQSFIDSFGYKTTVIIDCFEIFINRLTNLMARAQTFSNYKHHNTVKVLIGISPQGTNLFVSQAWGGRTSDKVLTENFGFLRNLLQGDLVLADRGFRIPDKVMLYHENLNIPAFTKGKSQLNPVKIEKILNLADARIHVERVTGVLPQKYLILQSTDYLMCNTSKDGKDVPLVN